MEMLSISLLVQERIEGSITDPPERAMLSFENHIQFYNMIVGVLSWGQGKNQKQYLLFL